MVPVARIEAGMTICPHGCSISWGLSLNSGHISDVALHTALWSRRFLRFLCFFCLSMRWQGDSSCYIWTAILGRFAAHRYVARELGRRLWVRNEGSESFGRIGGALAGCFCTACPVKHTDCWLSRVGMPFRASFGVWRSYFWGA